MIRPVLGLGLLTTFAAVGLGLRTAAQLRRYGDSGWRFLRSSPSGPEAAAQVLLIASWTLLLLAPVIGMLHGDAHQPLGPAWLTAPGSLVGGLTAATGTALCLAATGIMFLAQMQMGASWRIGVDPTERTSLVTGGLFRYVRNPIFTSMGVYTVGQALLVPNGVMLAALVLGIAALEVQVRRVEEPYLTATHGSAYRTWATARGRFLPGVGKSLS